MSAWLAAILGTAPAAAQGAPYLDRGLRWIGTASTCTAPAGWTAERLFRGKALPAALSEFCLYRWAAVAQDAAPTPADVEALLAASGARAMTEDVPVLVPAAFSSEEEALFTGLRGALRAQVGDASMLARMPAIPRTRVVVIDSAPDAPHGEITPGESRHGDTLAHLIEDLVCLPAGGACAAEVTTELALPWIASNVLGPHGGHIGTLADLARAVERAVSRWQDDRRIAPSTTPARLLINLSVGWEDTPGVADCSTSADRAGAPARAVRAILQHAAAQGALIVAAAGNDAGGPTPRTGLVCPGRYQAVRQDADPSQALLIAVSGLDYRDDPLATARPQGVTGIAALGLGGVAWDPADPVPPQLTGSSVATAVVSAIGALVWAQQPSWPAREITKAIYLGGVEVGAADACPMLLATCRSHRASLCGALVAAGAAPGCVPAAPKAWSCPALPAELAALDVVHAGVLPSAATPMPLTTIARHVAPGVQLGPWVFPMPIAATCPTCVVGSASMSEPPYLLLPALWQDLTDPALVVRLASDHSWTALSLGPLLSSATPYVFPLPTTWVVESAYITGLDGSGYSVTEQIVVQQ